MERQSLYLSGQGQVVHLSRHELNVVIAKIKKAIKEAGILEQFIFGYPRGYILKLTNHLIYSVSEFDDDKLTVTEKDATGEKFPLPDELFLEDENE